MAVSWSKQKNVSEVAAKLRTDLGLGTAALADTDDFVTAVDLTATLDDFSSEMASQIADAARLTTGTVPDARLPERLQSGSSLSIANQAEAEAGAENTKAMTALRTRQAIAAMAGGSSPEITLSGSQYDISGIPSTATEIDLVLYEVSLSANAYMNIQIGTSGGVEVAGYKASYSTQSNTNTGAFTSTDGFKVPPYSSATGPYSGVIKLHRVGSTNKWVADGHVKLADSAGAIANISGSKLLAGGLDRIRITTATGSPTLSGSVQVKWR